MLDFNDITMDGQGRVLVALSDGCNAACQANVASGSSGAVDRVMRQSSGTFLVAASPNVPEAPLALIIPLLGAAAALAAHRWRRQRLGPPAPS